MGDVQPRRPGTVAFLTMLTITMVGTMAGTMINAPLPDIQAEFRATESQVILPVAAFTVMMVIFAPLAGWLCDRAGPARVLLISISVMALTQFIAASSSSLEMLIIMRAFSGAACSTFPPGVQRGLVILWPKRAQSSLTAWASSIGLGMAVGPALGGFVAEFMGWRWIFVFHAAVCLLLAIIVLLMVPSIPGRKAPLHGLGMTVLMTTMGAAIIAITLVGQRAGAVAEIVVGVLAAVGMVVMLRLAARDPERLFEPRSLLEKRYLRGTVVAGVVMFVLGTFLVCLPLYLGEMGLTSGAIGLLLFTLALSMMLSGGVNTWLSALASPRLTMQIGLVLLVVTPLLLSAWLTTPTATSPGGLALVVVLLVLAGAGINAAQSVSAFAISRSHAAQNSLVFGIHNTMRFLGMGSGYAWAALMLPVADPLSVFAGATAMAAVALLVVIIGGPPAPLLRSDVEAA